MLIMTKKGCIHVAMNYKTFFASAVIYIYDTISVKDKKYASSWEMFNFHLPFRSERKSHYYKWWKHKCCMLKNYNATFSFQLCIRSYIMLRTDIRKVKNPQRCTHHQSIAQKIFYFWQKRKRNRSHTKKVDVWSYHLNLWLG